MAKGKPEENPKQASSAETVKPEKQNETRRSEQTNMVFLAAFVVIVAVCVAPLTAEISSRKYRNIAK